jgi:hypothetical protein
MAALSVCAYLASYVGTFRIMSKVAKTGVREVDRRYFVEEHAMAAVWQVVLCAVGAVLGEPDLRAGFTTFLDTPGALAPDVADRTHCLAGSDIPEPSATSLDDHRHTAVLIQQAVQQRLAEQFP